MTTTSIRASRNHRTQRLVEPSAVGDSHKSLRQLAKELGVSASYLSQVKSGKRPASQQLLNMLSSSDANVLLAHYGTSFPLTHDYKSVALPLRYSGNIQNNSLPDSTKQVNNLGKG